MMAALSKVISGSPMVIPATTYNAFIDAARDHVARQHAQLNPRTSQHRTADTVLIRNDSGSTRDRFDVLGIDRPIIAPLENEDEFLQQVVLCGVAPTAEHAQRFAVVSEPILSGSVGRAWISGVCPARVIMNDESDGYAQAVAGFSLLQSCSGGAAQLLWVEPVGDRPEPEIAWTVIRFGGTGSGGVVQFPSTAWAVIVAVTGTQPPYGYMGKALATPDGTPMGSDVDMFCLEEMGPGASGVHYVEVDSVVPTWQAEDNKLWFSRSNYRGTY